MSVFRCVCAACAALLLPDLAGCGRSRVAGTWVGREGDSPYFESVSFDRNRTFAARIREGQVVHEREGKWRTRRNQLRIDTETGRREYTYRVRYASLVITDPESGRAITLDPDPNGPTGR